MKELTLIALLAARAVAHPSGLWWGTDSCYPNPENTDNKCLESQEAGFDWSELANGDNWTFEGFNFVGFSPNNACGTSGGKCIVGKLSRDDNYMLRVDTSDAPFSVKKFHLSTSRKTDVLINYEMADGSSCHQVAIGTPEGRDINNHQCGGAVSVKFMLPEESKFGECDLNIHEIGFDCSAGPKEPIPPKPAPSTVPTSFIRHSTTIVEIPAPTDHFIRPIITTKEPSASEASSTICGPSATFCPAHSTVVSSTYTTSTTVWTAKSAETSIATHPISAITASQPSSPIASPPCPNLVPKCINTWLTIPKCSSNSDAACFCPSPEFTNRVESCIHAWGSSEKEISSALSYFAGICAPFVPKNPAIIDIAPTPPSSPSMTRPNSHLGTMTYPHDTTSTVTPAPRAPETTVTWSSSTMTCPKVGFSTFTHDSTPTVALVVPSSQATSASAPSISKQSTLPPSPSKTVTSCDMHKSFTTHPAPSPTEKVHFSSSGSKTARNSLWSLCLLPFFLFLI